MSVIPPDEAAKVPKHLVLPIASRFVRTDKSEKGVLKAASRLDLSSLDIFKMDLPKKKEVKGQTPRQFLNSDFTCS